MKKRRKKSKKQGRTEERKKGKRHLFCCVFIQQNREKYKLVTKWDIKMDESQKC
jgi:hypothetical protein